MAQTYTMPLARPYRVATAERDPNEAYRAPIPLVLLLVVFIIVAVAQAAAVLHDGRTCQFGDPLDQHV